MTTLLERATVSGVLIPLKGYSYVFSRKIVTLSEEEKDYRRALQDVYLARSNIDKKTYFKQYYENHREDLIRRNTIAKRTRNLAKPKSPNPNPKKRGRPRKTPCGGAAPTP